MTPRDSDIGYLVYDDVVVPITHVELRDGKTVFHSFVTLDLDETITIDKNASCTVVGVDGSQILWIPRTHEATHPVTSAYGGSMQLTQSMHATEAARRHESSSSD